MPPALFILRELRERELGDYIRSHLVQDRIVAGSPDIFDHAPGKPHRIVRSVRPAGERGPAVDERKEPVEYVAFQELLRGVQDDLLARKRRVDPYKVYGILKLIAETIRAARLVKSATRPDALRESLIF